MSSGYYSGQGVDISLTASGDMGSNEFRFVKAASTGGLRARFDLATGGSGPKPIGVLQDDPRSLEAGKIRVAGITMLAVNADTAISTGDFLTSNSVGHGVVTSTAGSNPYHAIALKDATSGSGVIIPALLENGTVHADNTP
jgi:hypothetical protein